MTPSSRVVAGWVDARHVAHLTDLHAAEIRVARLIAYMRPYLPSATVAVTQPIRVVIPAQRRATHPAEQRLDDQIADALRRRSLEVNRARTGPPRRR